MQYNKEELDQERNYIVWKDWFKSVWNNPDKPITKLDKEGLPPTFVSMMS